MPSIMYTDDNLNEKGFHAEYFKNIHFEGAPVVKQTEKKSIILGLQAQNWKVCPKIILCEMVQYNVRRRNR